MTGTKCTVCTGSDGEIGDGNTDTIQNPTNIIYIYCILHIWDIYIYVYIYICAYYFLNIFILLLKFIFLTQGLTILLKLAVNSWTKVILLS